MAFKKDIKEIETSCKNHIVGLKLSEDLKEKLRQRLENLVNGVLDQEVKRFFFFTNKELTAENLKAYFKRREVFNTYLFDHTKTGAKLKPHMDLYEERLMRYCRRFIK